MEKIETVDLACSEIPVLDALAHVVFVYRLSEVSEVVGVNLCIKLGFCRMLRQFELSRRSGQPHLHRMGVSRENLGPFSPGRAVTLVYHNVTEIVGRVMR